MTFTPVTHFDGLGGASRLGGAGYILNVNAGSKVPRTVGSYESYGGSFFHMCWHQGDLYAAHCELDSTIAMPFGGPSQCRGPYVHKWDGASWTAVGGEIDPYTSAAPTVVGDRFQATRPRIASDGTNLFVAYTDRVVTNIATGAATTWVRIAHWTGAAWAEVASRQCPSSIIFPALCAKSGLAYTAYYDGGNTVTVFRSNGSATTDIGRVSPGVGSASANGGACAVIVNRAGRPVGFYNRRLTFASADAGVMFDLDTGAEIAATPAPIGTSPIVPYGTNSLGGTAIAGTAILYGTDQIAVADGVYGALIVDDAGGQLVSLGGANNLSFVRASGIPLALDVNDPRQRQLWTVDGCDFNDPLNGPTDVYAWRAACSSAWAAGNPDNPPPAYTLNDMGEEVPDPGDAYLLGNRFFHNFYGSVPLLADASYLYAAVLYNPAIDSAPPSPPQPYWTQFIVYAYPILHDFFACAAYNSPAFHHRFRAAS